MYQPKLLGLRYSNVLYRCICTKTNFKSFLHGKDSIFCLNLKIVITDSKLCLKKKKNLEDRKRKIFRSISKDLGQSLKVQEVREAGFF